MHESEPSADASEALRRENDHLSSLIQGYLTTIENQQGEISFLRSQYQQLLKHPALKDMVLHPSAGLKKVKKDIGE